MKLSHFNENCVSFAESRVKQRCMYDSEQIPRCEESHSSDNQTGMIQTSDAVALVGDSTGSASRLSFKLKLGATSGQ